MKILILVRLNRLRPAYTMRADQQNRYTLTTLTSEFAFSTNFLLAPNCCSI